MRIAFLGTGLMGAGFVKRLLANGHELRVWNRTEKKARDLEAFGAAAFKTAAEAIEGVDRIHLILSDDPVVDATLEPLAILIPSTTWIIDHSTTSPVATGERAERWFGRERVYLHAPVMMSPQNAASGEGYMLISGKPDLVEKVLPDLAQMTGKVIRLGDRPDLAAAHKLIGNLTFLGMYGIAADIFRLAHASGIPSKDTLVSFEHFNPGEFLPQLANRIASGVYVPADFTIPMARKDVRLMLETATQAGHALRVTTQVAALQDEAIARGEEEWDTAAAFRYPLK